MGVSSQLRIRSTSPVLATSAGRPPLRGAQSAQAAFTLVSQIRTGDELMYYNPTTLRSRVIATTATSVKLPSTLKAELEKLARRSGETTHAVMVRALSEHVAAAKRHRSFLDGAARADVAMQESGIGYAMQDVHAYVAAKVRGERASCRIPARSPHWKGEGTP